MRVTRRFLAAAGAGGVLALLGVVLGRPVVLLGSVGVGAWLLARQYAFVRAVAELTGGIEVTHTVVPERPRTGDGVTAALGVAAPAGQPLHVAVEMAPPVATTGSEAAARRLTLAPGESAAETAATLDCPVAGRFAFGRPRLRASDPLGLFVATARVGPAPTIEVESRTPRDIHVGRGGDRVAAAYGDHKSGSRGAGLEPVELREYVPGDPASRIDWNATARLAAPHVLEFEAETDRRTVLLVDHRASTGEGRDGETPLDYLRAVGLAVAGAARRADDPLALYAVGDGGLTASFAPDTGADHYRAVRDCLLDLQPTGGDPGTGSGGAGDPAAARRAAARLDGEGSAFAARLAPFFSAAVPYVRRLDAEPLFRTARGYVDRLKGQRWTVLLTDDRRPTEVTETVRLLRRGDDRVLVLLAPHVLYAPGGLADIDDAYQRYLRFEELRRDLDGLDRVSALEVGPGERVAALLSARRDRRAGRAGGG